MRRIMALCSALSATLLLAAPAWSQGELCSNGSDDDGDGLIDCADLDCFGTSTCPVFLDDFESYPLGFNPTTTYDYLYLPIWSDVPPPEPDRFQVTMLDGNQVLAYYFDGPSFHFPWAGKLLRADVETLHQAGVTFYRNSYSPGFFNLVFGWKSETDFYTISTSYTNELFITRRGGVVDETALWPDTNVLEIEPGIRLEVHRQGQLVTGTLTRLDTGEQKTVEATIDAPLGGQVGFSVNQDWYGGFYANVDDFLVAGTVAQADSDGDGVPDSSDVCPDSEIPETVPTWHLATNRWALVDADGIFDTVQPAGRGPARSFTIEATGGCTCAQIINLLDLGEGHSRFGCSTGAMDRWIDSRSGSSP